VLPDFLIIGAPKAGTTALHTALARHPELYFSPIKEPKFFLCDGRRPERQAGPGDAHSVQEWIWRQHDYEDLFADAPPHARRGESTPFYLYDRAAHLRIAELVPSVQMIVVLRDPVDRAYSNWMHAWSDGLEPVDDFLTACKLEDERVAAGWAPFWHYRRLGLYASQLEHLFRLFPRDQVHILRYKELVDTPVETLNAICALLGIEQNLLALVPPENSRNFVEPSRRNHALARIVRAGAGAAAYLPPQLWRKLSLPLIWALQRDGTTRPRLPVEHRRFLVRYFADDIHRLETLTGHRYDSWLSDHGRGAFATRQELSVAR
jgi:hypothetical protein